MWGKGEGGCHKGVEEVQREVEEQNQKWTFRRWMDGEWGKGEEEK